jgi:hypothetical protein
MARWAGAGSRSDLAGRLATAVAALGADWVDGPDAHGSPVAHSAGGQ